MDEIELKESILTLRFSPLKLLSTLQSETEEKALGPGIYGKIIEKRQEGELITDYSFEDTVLSNLRKMPNVTTEEFLNFYAPGFRPRVGEILNSPEAQEIMKKK